jgi:hypothetical protein
MYEFSTSKNALRYHKFPEGLHNALVFYDIPFFFKIKGKIGSQMILGFWIVCGNKCHMLAKIIFLV